MKLSPVQQLALQEAQRCGHLIRWPGGYWTTLPKRPGLPVPEIYVGTNTVNALVKKGLLRKVQSDLVLLVDDENDLLPEKPQGLADGVCPECKSTNIQEIVEKDYVGDRGSEKVYQYVVVAYRCEDCGCTEEN